MEQEENKLNDIDNNNDEESKIEVVKTTKKLFDEVTSNEQPIFDPITKEPILQRNIPNKIIVAQYLYK